MSTLMVRILVMSMLWGQIGLPDSTVEPKTVELSVEADWYYEKEAEVVFIKGQTNLPPGTLLRVELKGGIAMPSDADKVALLDLVWITVDNDGAWMLRSSNLKSNFTPEYYEIIVSIAPDQSRDLLVSEGFSERDLDQAKGYYLLNILSVQLIKRRKMSVGQLVKLINETYRLDNQLREKITEIEELKKGDTEIARRIREAVGLNKEEMLTELGKQWFVWANLWLEHIDRLIARTKTEQVCLMSAETIYGFLHELRNRYLHYCSVAFNEKKELVYDLIEIGVDRQIKPNEIKQKHYQIFETEIVHKITHDITACLSILTQTFEKTISQPPPTHDKWSQTKQEMLNHLAAVKEELTGYTKYELFLEKLPPVRDIRKKEDYTQLLTLIELTMALADKFGLRLVDPTNDKLKKGSQELINLINQKARDLLNKAR